VATATEDRLSYSATRAHAARGAVKRGDRGRVLINAQMSGFWGEAEILCSTRALPGSDPDADPYSSWPLNRLDLRTAFEAGRAEVLAWEQAASVPSAGITLQQTDTPFCRGQLAIAGSCAAAPDIEWEAAHDPTDRQESSRAC
jgi:hypothetical protein